MAYNGQIHGVVLSDHKTGPMGLALSMMTATWYHPGGDSICTVLFHIDVMALSEMDAFIPVITRTMAR